MDQVMGVHQVRLDKHDAELESQRQLLEDLRSEIRLFRHEGLRHAKQANDSSSDTSSTADSFTPAEWCPKSVLVRGWAPFGAAASCKIDRIEYKKAANELLSCLPLALRNNVMVRAPYAANHQITFGVKGDGGWESCRAVQLALSAGIESNAIEVRGHELKVSIELSPHKKSTLRNMFRAESFLKKIGTHSESHTLCHKSSKILSQTNEELGGTPKGSSAWALGWQDGKNSRIDYPAMLLTFAYEERNVSSV